MLASERQLMTAFRAGIKPVRTRGLGDLGFESLVPGLGNRCRIRCNEVVLRAGWRREL